MHNQYLIICLLILGVLLNYFMFSNEINCRGALGLFSLCGVNSIILKTFVIVLYLKPSILLGISYILIMVVVNGLFIERFIKNE